MFLKFKTKLTLLLGIILATASLNQGAWAQGKAENTILSGRSAVEIVDGKYPASYFPNTEVLGAEEMRITALGTGMPNQTCLASINLSGLASIMMAG